MSLAGTGAIAIWNDVKEGKRDLITDWHDRDHIPERTGIPGFLRGRRFAALEGSPEFFILYETADGSAAQSPAYFARLNNPSPWTAKANKDFLGTIRGICDVAASLGHGEGGCMLTLRADPAETEAASVDAAVIAALPAIVAEHGVLAAHWLVAQRAVSLIETNERVGRAPLRAPNRILMIEGIAPDSIKAALAKHLPALAGDVGVYRLEVARAAGHRD